MWRTASVVMMVKRMKKGAREVRTATERIGGGAASQESARKQPEKGHMFVGLGGIMILLSSFDA